MKKQSVVSRSSVEAFECRGQVASYGSTDDRGGVVTLVTRGFWCSVAAPSPLLPVNTSTISIARDTVKHELTKHIGVDLLCMLLCKIRFSLYNMCLLSCSSQTSHEGLE
jgi:hypothetical protein